MNSIDFLTWCLKHFIFVGSTSHRSWCVPNFTEICHSFALRYIRVVGEDHTHKKMQNMPMHQKGLFFYASFVAVGLPPNWTTKNSICNVTWKGRFIEARRGTTIPMWLWVEKRWKSTWKSGFKDSPLRIRSLVESYWPVASRAGWLLTRLPQPPAEHDGMEGGLLPVPEWRISVF